MKAALIIYSVSNQPSKVKNQLRVKLNGYKDIVKGGKYIYDRKGFLDTIPHLKTSPGTIIVPQSKKNRVIRLLKKYNAQIKNYEIVISKKYLSNPTIKNKWSSNES